MKNIPSVVLLALSDSEFIKAVSSNITVDCTTETYKKIIERIEKLNLKIKTT